MPLLRSFHAVRFEPHIYIHGFVEVPTPGHTVNLVFCEPQGPDPSDLWVELIIIPPAEPCQIQIMSLKQVSQELADQAYKTCHVVEGKEKKIHVKIE